MYQLPSDFNEKSFTDRGKTLGPLARRIRSDIDALHRQYGDAVFLPSFYVKNNQIGLYFEIVGVFGDFVSFLKKYTPEGFKPFYSLAAEGLMPELEFITSLHGGALTNATGLRQHGFASFVRSTGRFYPTWSQFEDAFPGELNLIHADYSEAPVASVFFQKTTNAELNYWFRLFQHQFGKQIGAKGIDGWKNPLHAFTVEYVKRIGESNNALINVKTYSSLSEEELIEEFKKLADHYGDRVQFKSHLCTLGEGEFVGAVCGPNGRFETWREFLAAAGVSRGLKQQRTLNIKRILEVLNGLKNNLGSLTPRELYVLFQQQELGDLPKELGGDLIEALETGEIVPADFIEWFDEKDADVVAESIEVNAVLERSRAKENRRLDLLEEKRLEFQEQKGMPNIGGDLSSSTLDALMLLGDDIWATDDKEAVQTLIASCTDKIWDHAFNNEEEALQQLKSTMVGNAWCDEVREDFLETYELAKSLQLPHNYIGAHEPRLMQNVVAALALVRRRLLVLSTMGSGKSFASELAIMHTRRKRVLMVIPNVNVEKKKAELERDWAGIEVITRDKRPSFQGNGVQVLVMNFEAFSRFTDNDVAALLQRFRIDAVIIDEVQKVKQSGKAPESRRREMVSKLVSAAGEITKDLVVLGMSGTAIENDLMEGRKLIEMVFSEVRYDLQTETTRHNAMRMFQEFVRLGVRQKTITELPPKNRRHIEIRADELTKQLQFLKYTGSSIAAYEHLVFKPKVKTIVELAAEQPTVIATQFTSDIVEPLRRALLAQGLKVGVFTGELKIANCTAYDNSISEFIAGATDVLIASTECVATGFDGLQRRASRMIFATLPWKPSTVTQCEDRLHRPGMFEPLEVITIAVVMSYETSHGTADFSYCNRRLAALRAKQLLADCAIDGQLPSSDSALTPHKALNWLEDWLDRIKTDGLHTRQRHVIRVPLVFKSELEEVTARKFYGDMSVCHNRWNNQASSRTSADLRANPQTWEIYQTDLMETRRGWEVDPLQEVIEHCGQYSGLVIGDFGCGTAQLAEALRGKHTVHSFDHLAINDEVTACDIGAGVPLEAGTLDIAVFSLSLMGSNWRDYLIEARRCLRPNGQLIIWNPLSQSIDGDLSVAVRSAGFKEVTNETVYKWRRIWAVCDPRSSAKVLSDVEA